MAYDFRPKKQEFIKKSVEQQIGRTKFIQKYSSPQSQKTGITPLTCSHEHCEYWRRGSWQMMEFIARGKRNKVGWRGEYEEVEEDE